MSGWSLALSFPVMVLAVGLWVWSGWLCYANWHRSGRRRSTASLEGLRVLLITLLGFTLLRPEWVRHIQRTEKPEVTVLCDASASMLTRDVLLHDQVVSRLEKRGWVRRTPDPTDGRTTLATLTDDGWAKVVQTAPGHVETVRSLAFDPLTRAQVRQVCEIGRRITRAIDLDTDVTYRAVRIGPGGLGRQPVTSRHAQCRAACHVASQDRARGLFRALRPDPTGWLAPRRGRWLAAHQR